MGPVRVDAEEAVQGQGQLGELAGQGLGVDPPSGARGAGVPAGRGGAAVRAQLLEQGQDLVQLELELHAQLVHRGPLGSPPREDRGAQVGRALEALLLAAELLDHEALEALEAVAALLEDHAAAQGHHGREQAQHEAVARGRDDRLLEAHLDQALLAGRDRLAVEQHELTARVVGAGVQAHGHAVGDRAVEGREGGQARADHGDRPEEPRRRHHRTQRPLGTGRLLPFFSDSFTARECGCKLSADLRN